MSERHTHASAHGRPKWPVRAMVTCALLTAVSVVLARFLIPTPNEVTRFSLEAVPIFLAGMLFGPLPGALTGFAADFIGCLFSPYGYNPIFCVPPILYGPVRRAFPSLADPQVQSSASGGGVFAGGGSGVHPVPELRLGHDLWRRRESRVLSHPAGGPQRAVCHYRRAGRAGGVASAAFRRSAGPWACRRCSRKEMIYSEH